MRYGRNGLCQRVVKVQKPRIEVTCMDKSCIPEGRNTKRGGKSTTVAMGDRNGMRREI